MIMTFLQLGAPSPTPSPEQIPSSERFSPLALIVVLGLMIIAFVLLKRAHRDDRDPGPGKGWR